MESLIKFCSRLIQEDDLIGVVEEQIEEREVEDTDPRLIHVIGLERGRIDEAVDGS